MFTLWTLGAMFKWPINYAFEDTEHRDSFSLEEIQEAYDDSRVEYDKFCSIAVRIGLGEFRGPWCQYGVRYKVF